MKKNRLWVIGIFTVALIAAVGIPTKPQLYVQNGEELVFMAGRNVNMVSGTTLPDGDPYLQRQNEPSLAVSSRNPMHLLAGSNDYRTVDIPIVDEELPGIEEMMAADAWVSYYTSDDGGESWKTRLLPGFPQDTSDEGMNSPIKGFSTAADSWVIAGSKGRFYYSGLAFNRGGNESALFVARFEDTNDKENGNNIVYRGNTVVVTGNAGQFVDMPRSAVDVPRGASNDVVFLVYTVFVGNLDVNIRSKMYCTRSTDGGLTWSSPVKLSESQHIIQGAAITVDPLNGDVYIAFRRFYHKSQENGIIVVKSTDRGQTFSNPDEIATFPAASFDQPATPNEILYPDPDDYVPGESIRTNSYPTIAVDDNHRVYVAWSERNRGPGGEARIVMKTSLGGSTWSPGVAMDINPPGSVNQGHEFMPQWAYGAGKMTLIWYDQRFDQVGHDVGFEHYIGDWITNTYGDVMRHTIDVWAAQFNPADYADPTQWSYTQVSRYLYALLVDEGGEVFLVDGYPYIYPVQFNCLNYPMFKGGFLPFMGDYIALAASPTILNQNGQWVFNTEYSENPVFHAAWTDNRDVRPPAGLFDWTDYTPADSAQDPIYVSPGRTNCSAGGNRPAIRNQNIYTSKLFWGIVAGSPANEKSLDLSVPRAFVIFVQNNTEFFLRVRMTITEQPLDGEASFFQFDSLDELFVTIAPYSTISRQVFLQSTDPNDSARIDIVEVDAADIPIPGGLSGYVIINGDPSNDGVSGGEEHHQPQFSNPNIVNWVVNPNIVNPNIVNPNIVNPNIVNEPINPNIVNPNIVNPNIVNPNIVNPNIVNPNIVNPNIVNPNIVNPNIVNPNIVNAGLPEDIENVPVFDVMWTVTNEGNTATTYTLDTVADKAPPPGIYTQLLIYRVHKTPAIAGSVLSSSSPDYDECTLYEEPHHELILNILNPNIVNPNIVNLGSVNPNIVNPNIVNESITNATFALGPGEEAFIDLRVLDTEGATTGGNLIAAQDEFSIQTFDLMEFIYSIGFVVTSMAVDSDDAAAGITIPKGAATDLYIVSSNPPDGLVTQYYETYLTAFGGTAPYNYTWSLNSGELPPGLSISTGTTLDPQVEGAPGIISGTPTTAGTYVFIVQVTDDNNPLHVDTQLFSITTFTGSIPDTPTITTTSLPSGVKGTWYGATIHVAGGDPPFTFSWTAAGTPTPEADGLMLDPVNGIITGTPTVATSYNFDVTVTDYDTQTSLPVNLDLDILDSTGNYFIISGTVYDDIGDPLSGVHLYGLPNSPMTDSNGYYEDNVPEGWSGTVIPFKLNYSFIPENRVYVQVSTDQYGQDYNQQEWYATQSDVVRVTDMVVDSFGNAYVSGVGNSGAYVAKFDNTGTFQWDYRDGSTSDDLFYGLCVDPDGNVYVTGIVNEDIKTVKLDPDGIVQWSDVYDSGYDDDEGLDIAIDALGNVFVTGASATATFEQPDFITIKYEPSGTRVWEKIYDNGDIDRGHRVAIDSEGNIIAAGDSVDLVGGTGSDLFIFKYDTLGNVIWTARYDNSFSLDAVEDLCLDSAGNVYVTGWTSTGENQADYLTVKYSNPGVFGWASTYDGAGDQFDDWAYAITVDADGYVYVTGRSGENVCDPGPPVMICDDYATIKYDPSGNPVWTPGGDIDPYGAARYDGPPGVDHDVAQDIEVDPLGNVYVTGRSVGNDGSFDFATLIYNSSGVNIWEARYGIDSRNDEAGEIELDPEGNIFVSGPSGDELLLLKYSQSFPSTLSITTETLPNGTAGLPYNTVLEAFGGTGLYDWSISAGSLPAGLFINGPTGVIFGTPTTAGTINFTVEVTSGALTDSKPMSITISVAPASQVELTGPGTVAAGDVSGAFTLTSQNSVGVPTNVTTDTVFDLSSDTSGTATFYSDSGGNNVITQVTITNGTNNATFYYKDTAVGAPTVTAAWASGGTDLGSDTHSISVSAPATPTQVELTGPDRVGGGFISEAFTLESQDIGGNPYNVTQDTVFGLSSDSSGIFTFYSDPEGTISIDEVTIPAGQNSVTFYYMDAVPATPTVTATRVSGDPGLGPANLQTTVWAVVGQIAFASDRDGDYEIFIMNADGSGQIQVTDNNDADAYPSWSAQGSKIAFQSDRDGNNEIYIMNADGSGQTRLTDNPAQDNFPKWSPDGSKIVFTSSRDGNDEIYVMNADGSSQTNLTINPASDLYPSWSPDGTKISFMSTRDGDSEIFVMDADGSNPIQLTFNTIGNAYSSWSPDGSKIAYSNGSGTTCEIYIMNADGSNPTQLTNNSSFDSIPSWSPDGSRIVFLSYRDGHDQVYTMNADGSGQMNITNTPTKESWPNWGGAKIAFTSYRDGNSEIYIMNADGSGQTRITNEAQQDHTPSWSPNGIKIAFTSTRDGNEEIYTMNADGSAQTCLTNNLASDKYPSWSPDGTKIAFTSDRDGNEEIYAMNADGSAQTRLTNEAEVDWLPSWSPDGTKIVFSSNRDFNQEIYVMNADGSAQTNLTNYGGATDIYTSWSPDGTKIAFSSTRDGDYEIYVMNADGSAQTRITNEAEVDHTPCWSPDGSKIAFTSTRDGDYEIYAMNADGSGQTNLTDYSAYSDSWATWRPQPRILASLVTNQVVLSGPASVEAGAVSGAFTLTSQNSLGMPTNVIDDTVFDLTSTSGGTFNFYSDAGGTNEISQVTLASGTSGITFYYKDTEVNLQTVTATYNSGPVDLGNSTHGINITSAAASQVGLTGPSSVVAGAVSGIFTLESQNSLGDPTSVTADTVFNLSSDTSGTATFYSDAGGTSVITQVTITNGTNNANFYYKDTAVGTPTVAASWASGGTDLGSDTHSIQVTAPTLPTQIELSGPAKVGGGFISEALTLTSQDGVGTPVPVTQNTIFDLSSNSSGISTFYSDPDGAIPITQATIPAGQSFVEFYYMDNMVGTPTVTATWASGGSDLGSDDHQTTIWAVVGQIAFTSNRDGNQEIYIMNADGTGQTRLTNNSTHDQFPSWSPDGSKIAFTSNRDENQEIYIMNADGSRQMRLTNEAQVDTYPSWSPDGTKVAFMSNRDGNTEIYVMNADGSGQTNLSNNSASDIYPSWSPDGTKIAFQSSRDGDAEIYVMNADGTGQTNLTNEPGYTDNYPSWSPDGSKVVFHSNRGGDYEIYVMNADGSGQTPLTNNLTSDSFASWSPDGSNIVFVNITAGNYEIYIMNADGSGQTRLTIDSAVDNYPDWGGAKIAFTSNRDGNDEIYIMNADGSGQTRLTNNSTNEDYPSWSPDGTKIAFHSNQSGNTDIYVMNSDGTNTTPLTNNPASDACPRWSPDGTKIIFISQRDGDYEIYIMNADGTGQTNLTNNPIEVDTNPDWSPYGSKITFISDRDGNYDIYAMNANGTEQSRLLDNSGWDQSPCWSPDGTRIAFENNQTGDFEIYVIEADGTNVTRLTNNASADQKACWSPDGRKIGFYSWRTGNAEIFVMNADGTNVTQLTNNSGRNKNPSWRPQPRIIPHSYEFVTKWGTSGTGDSQFQWPVGVAIDSSGYVYVTDHHNHRIQKFTSDGTFEGWWGLDDLGYTGWHDPGSGRTGSAGSGDGQLSLPDGIAVDSSGSIYVIDEGNSRIQVFTSNGTFVTKWGSLGTGDGQFGGYFFGIAVDNSGYVYVADRENYRIQKFTSDGTFEGWWGLDDLGYTGWHDPGSGRTGMMGFENGQFFEPHGIAVDSSGYVYVADSFNDRIQKFTSNGSFVTKWGSGGSGDGQFNFALGIAIDSSDLVYVMDKNNNRIQVFTSDGTFVTKWGSGGSGDGQFDEAYLIAIDSSDYVYVADLMNSRIQKFRKQ